MRYENRRKPREGELLRKKCNIMMLAEMDEDEGRGRVEGVGRTEWRSEKSGHGTFCVNALKNDSVMKHEEGKTMGGGEGEVRGRETGISFMLGLVSGMMICVSLSLSLSLSLIVYMHVFIL